MDSSKLELISQIFQMAEHIGNSESLFVAQTLEDSTESKSELKLVRLISEIIQAGSVSTWDGATHSIMLVIMKIITLIKSKKFNGMAKKSESKLIVLVTQAVSLFNSMDMDSLPKPLFELISLTSQYIGNDHELGIESVSKFTSLTDQTLELKPHPQLISLIRQIVAAVISRNTRPRKLISLCPQRQVSFNKGKFYVTGEVALVRNERYCLLGVWEKFKLRDDVTHFLCLSCNGEYHKDVESAPLEITHRLHHKHSLHLVLRSSNGTRECYCCQKNLKKVFYYCSACDFALNIACVEKPPLLSTDHPKWHQHTLYMFPRQTSLTCNVCALAHSTCPFYMCPPCDFVIHQRCISLPRVIRISRHPHRISFTLSFNQGDWSCGVCRRKIDNDYGGYTCMKDGCSYGVHSKCGTRRNIWDGVDLDGEPEETEEEVAEPFEKIGEGIIRHFGHEDLI